MGGLEKLGRYGVGNMVEEVSWRRFRKKLPGVFICG